MKIFKKISALLLVLAMFAVAPISAFAATDGLNANARSILTRLEQANVPAGYITQARQHLAAPWVDATPAQATAVNAQIDNAVAALAEYGYTIAQVQAWPDSLRDRIVGYVETAAAVFQLTLIWNGPVVTIGDDGLFNAWYRENCVRDCCCTCDRNCCSSGTGGGGNCCDCGDTNGSGTGGGGTGGGGNCCDCPPSCNNVGGGAGGGGGNNIVGTTRPPVQQTGLSASTGLLALLALTGVAGGAGLVAKKKD